MIPTTSREFRAKTIAATGRQFFDCDEDYYTYQHLNDRVQLFHSISFVAAAGIFVLSIVKLSIVLFVIQYMVSTGGAILGHWLFDGFVPSGPVKTPARVLYFGIRKNIGFLLGKSSKKEADFFKKYPFALKAFSTEAR